MRRAVRRLRERLVLGPVRAALGSDEEVIAWGHVQAPLDGRHGVLALTKTHCVIHWIARDHVDVVAPWDEVGSWDVRAGRGGPIVVVRTGTTESGVQLPISSRARARRASALLSTLAGLAPARARGTEGLGGDGEFPLRPARRGFRGHTRRVLATLAGTLLILLGLLFASPFLPGPGALTILAGLAILATEYDWARDIYNWLRGRVERFREWGRARRARRRALRAEPPAE